MRYHPRIGYTYMPSVKLRVQGLNGGYLVRTNAAGFRSEREFVRERHPGTFRALLFGDSHTAGDGAANQLRYSDVLETLVPGVEVYNYALTGTGTDQQYLTYKENESVEHDLIIIGLYVENVRRITRQIIKSRDINGEEYFRPKPYYLLQNGSLALHNVPVPKQPWTEATLPKELLPHVYTFGEEYSFFRKPSRPHAAILRNLVPPGPLRKMMKAIVTPFRKWNPLPDYDAPDSPGWVLLRKILEMWIADSKTPVLLVPLPHDSVLTGLSDARNCQARFRELARDTGCHVFDPLPALLQLPDDERRVLWSTSYAHFSVRGHQAFAKLLAPVIQRYMVGGGADRRG